MKNLIIGLGSCGNNLVNSIQNELNPRYYKTVSIQKDLQILGISKADFKLNPRDNIFEEKLTTLLQHSKKVVLIMGTAGTSATLYLKKLFTVSKSLNKNVLIFCVTPAKIEGGVKLSNSVNVIKELDDMSADYKVFNNDNLVLSDKEITDELKDIL